MCVASRKVSKDGTVWNRELLAAILQAAVLFISSHLQLCPDHTA